MIHLGLKNQVSWFIVTLCFVTLQSSEALVYNLGRVRVPTHREIEHQKKLKKNRAIYRYGATAGVSLSVVALLYVAASIRHQMSEAKKTNLVPGMPLDQLMRMVQQKAQAPDHASARSAGILWPVTSMIDGVKNMGVSCVGFGKDFASFLADSTTVLAAGVITSALYECIRKQIVHAYQDETVGWFVAQQTKINIILEDLKVRTAEYDLHGALLSSEMLHQDTQVHLKAFISDISSAASDCTYRGACNDPDYFAFLLGEVKRKYARKAETLEQMQEQLMPLVAQRHRSVESLEYGSLCQKDAQARADIAELASLLVQEMVRLIAFIDAHPHEHQPRVAGLIDCCNRFLDQVEEMLSAPFESIIERSKANRGLFTVTYEYQRLFDQQVDFLDSYCKIITG